jgi:hypothetical protein
MDTKKTMASTKILDLNLKLPLTPFNKLPNIFLMFVGGVGYNYMNCLSQQTSNRICRKIWYVSSSSQNNIIVSI